MTAAPSSLTTDRSLLIVEDDKALLERLARAMEGRGFTVTTAQSVSDGLLQVEAAAPAFAIVDMRLGDGHGLGRHRQQKDRAAEKSDVPQSCALGAYPAHLRSMRPQRFGNRPPPQDA